MNYAKKVLYFFIKVSIRINGTPHVFIIIYFNVEIQKEKFVLYYNKF